MISDFIMRRQIEGLITFWLDKSEESTIFETVCKVFESFCEDWK